jgi:hypothetical protein
MFTGNINRRRSFMGKTAAREALDPHADKAATPPPQAECRPAEVEYVLSESVPTNVVGGTGVVFRFFGLVSILFIVVGSLIFAIARSSVPGMVLMTLTVIASAMCVYFAAEDLRNVRSARTR